MARIVFGSYFFRYPLGAMMSHVLQYLVGLKRLGHDVIFVEKAGYANACFDPTRNVMSDDCRYGLDTGAVLLKRFGFADRWCFVDAFGTYHGLRRDHIERVFADSDLFIDVGTHGSWLAEAQASGRRILIDGEPGFNQIKMTKALEAGATLDDYDLYFTNGMNVGTPASPAPSAGRHWEHVFHPVVTYLFKNVPPPPPEAPFTTLMNWRSHEPIEYRGITYGQKDVEFEHFAELPSKVDVQLVLAIGGPHAPKERLGALGWQVQDGHRVTISYDSFVDSIAGSAGEFAVCKNVFVALNTGWFSDRSAAYLAAGRPVIMQETGFSRHLPTGEGLFAVRNVDEAVAAIEEVRRRPEVHRQRAREIAREHLEAETVLSRVLDIAAAGPRGGNGTQRTPSAPAA